MTGALIARDKSSRGLLARQYHFLDAGKYPKQIDITLAQVNGPQAIKGITCSMAMSCGTHAILGVGL